MKNFESGEILILILNAYCFLYFLWKWDQPGKILYWLGATILMLGLFKMKG